MNRAENDLLTQVGMDAPMGQLLRRYWHPIAAAAELRDRPVKPLRLLGENLVLYRDRESSHGLIDRQCAHRRADMAHGIVERCGLRCHYHGWLYNHEGRCLAQPFEDTANPASNYKDRIRIKAYPVQALAGMLWAYLGPEPAPLVPNWEPFTWDNGFRQIVYADVPCNWLQCQENSCDPVHFEWMHRNWASRQRNETAPYGPAHLKLAFEEHEFGHIYRRTREDADERNDHWTIGSMALFPNAFFLGDHIEWRVPVDDENTFSITWSYVRVPKEREPFVQKTIPYWQGPVKDPATGRLITSHVMNQDFAAWLGQGRIADRTQEHLGRSDDGIRLMRHSLRKALKAIADGEDPMGLIRDPARNRCVQLPIKHREQFIRSQTLQEMRRSHAALGYRSHTSEYLFQAGMPEDVKRAYQEAIGIG